MTAKHFIWFATWLDQYPNLIQDYDALDDLMAFFAISNEKFDRRRFLSAAGFSDEEITEIWGND